MHESSEIRGHVAGDVRAGDHLTVELPALPHVPLDRV